MAESGQRPQACLGAFRPETLAERREFGDRDVGAGLDLDALAVVKELDRRMWVPTLEEGGYGQQTLEFRTSRGTLG